MGEEHQPRRKRSVGILGVLSILAMALFLLAAIICGVVAFRAAARRGTPPPPTADPLSAEAP